MKIFLMLLLVTCSLIYAQPDFRVSGYEINGEITIENPVDLSFGRYEVYEFYLEEGDHYSVGLNSPDFWPAMFIVTPSKEVIIKYATTESNVSIDSVSTETGNWEVYVICDTTQMGSFNISMNFTDKNSYAIKPESDFCDGVQFYSAHSENNFFFLNKSNLGKFNDVKSISLVQDETNQLVVKIVDDSFEDLKNKLKTCLGGKWLWKNESEKTTYSQIGSSKKIVLTKTNNGNVLTFYKNG
ncbi:MAG: hypothetical protein K9J12_06740 [Melioribacteraceae bacterium]|nr:hypothetical protein [Melioribacteraceae bacterium]MCF8265573.1 hypothetical protein [Melioribacteraceae bacterium]MCF8431622.1 hypothetical protein [Melioribacteraceae bacterium]